jgi:hypothetical protein
VKSTTFDTEKVRHDCGNPYCHQCYSNVEENFLYNVKKDGEKSSMRKMTFEEFDKMLEQIHKNELKIGASKGKEYVLKDRLDNFHRIGNEVQTRCPRCGHMYPIGPFVALWVYLKKHLDAILQFINRGETLSETIEERILDGRVYLSLLQGLIEEKKSEPDVEVSDTLDFRKIHQKGE